MLLSDISPQHCSCGEGWGGVQEAPSGCPVWLKGDSGRKSVVTLPQGEGQLWRSALEGKGREGQRKEGQGNLL